MIDKDTRILVVDDFSTMRRIIKNNLKGLGYLCVDDAEDGRSALELLRVNDYGLVLCDWNMPGMSGLDLLRAVRREPRFSALPFVMITAEAKRVNIVEAVQAGVTSYVVKPFKAATLVQKLNALGVAA